VLDQLNGNGIGYVTNGGSCNGNQIYYSMVDGAKTSGGYTQVKYGGNNALYDIVNRYGTTVENIVVSFTHRSGHSDSNPGAGHTNFLYAIVDGNIYFSERYDGYGSSIRRVMENRKTQPGILGVVADLIRTKQEYETAIETALGGSIQNIVTEDENTARAMIEFLKREKAGRATFLPLTAIRGAQTLRNSDALSEPGVIGLASSLVTSDKKYEKLSVHLLGKTIVADTIGNAIALAKKYKYTLRIVTLEGELLNPGGAMTGGAFKNSSNLLGRRREMAELQEKVAKCRAEADRLRQAIEDTKSERNRLRARLETIRMTLQSRFLEQNTTRVNIIQEQEKKESAADDLELLREFRLIDDIFQHGPVFLPVQDLHVNVGLLRRLCLIPECHQFIPDLVHGSLNTFIPVLLRNPELLHPGDPFSGAFLKIDLKYITGDIRLIEAHHER
jgi:hypothetical protein